jgi:hypothetical protein
LTASLNIARSITSTEIVDEFAQQSETQYGVLAGGSTMHYFNHSKQTIMKNIWNSMQQNKVEAFLASTSEGIEKVRRSNGNVIVNIFVVKIMALIFFSGRFAFFLDALTNEYISNQLPCNTRRAGDIIALKGYGIATPHGSYLRQAMNTAVLELFDLGFLDQLKQKWFYKRDECKTAVKSNQKGIPRVTLADVADIFYILIIGCGVAIVTAIFELLIVSKFNSSRLNKPLVHVLRDHLRISLMGIGQDEKDNAQCNVIERNHDGSR